MSDVASSTPGANQVVEITHKGGLYRVRRPSRADERTIARVWDQKLGGSTILMGLDPRLQWEARLEVCLTPRNKALDLGECAPDNLIVEVAGERRIIFDRIDTEEFDALCEALLPAFEAKKKPPPENCGDTAGVVTSV